MQKRDKEAGLHPRHEIPERLPLGALRSKRNPNLQKNPNVHNDTGPAGTERENSVHSADKAASFDARAVPYELQVREPQEDPGGPGVEGVRGGLRQGGEVLRGKVAGLQGVLAEGWRRS